MTFRFNTKHLVLCLSLSVFFSCKKDDNTPTPPPADPTLFELVQGRWNAEVDPPARSAGPAASPKNQETARVSSVEFFSDSSYILVFNHHNVFTGKLSVADSTSFNLNGEEVSAITNLKISEDSISFTCAYHNGAINVKAGKVEELNVSADKKPLLKTWVLSEEEDGAGLYDQMQIANGEKITMFFSAAGTFLTRYGNDDDMVIKNWKWHPQVANAAVEYRSWESDDDIDYNTYYKIAEISGTALTIQMIHLEDDEEVVAFTYVLTAQ